MERRGLYAVVFDPLQRSFSFPLQIQEQAVYEVLQRNNGQVVQHRVTQHKSLAFSLGGDIRKSCILGVHRLAYFDLLTLYKELALLVFPYSKRTLDYLGAAGTHKSIQARRFHAGGR